MQYLSLNYFQAFCEDEDITYFYSVEIVCNNSMYHSLNYFTGLSLADVGHTRDKRSVMRLGEMISCTTKKNMMEVLQQFNGYGCWCGFGGKGQAIDPVDG